MPFTFAHPAAVLPLTYLPKKYISFTALIIGSIMPDMEYFLRFNGYSYFSHSWAGLLYFDLPLGLALCFLFHNLIRNLLIDSLPTPLYVRTVRCKNFDWNQAFRNKWPFIVLCILIGGISHITWDHLTHEITTDLDQTQFIRHEKIPHKQSVVYYSYWGLNSVFGMILLAISFWKMPVQKIQKHLWYEDLYWPVIIGIATFVFMLRLWINCWIGLIGLVDTGISGMMIGMISISLSTLKRSEKAGPRQK